MNKVVAISGYKPNELGIFGQNHPGIKYIKTAITRKLITLIDDGLEWVIISGQLGVELWAGEITIELQETYPHIKLAVITPFLQQEENWKDENKELYEYVISHADYVNSLTHKKYENPSQFKLKTSFFITKSDALLLVYDEENPGSPKFMLSEAKKRQGQGSYDLLIINAYDIQSIVEEEQMNYDNWTT